MGEQVKYIFLAILFIAFFTLELQAQTSGYLEDEGSNLWNQESFIESNQNEESFGEAGGDYIGDGELKSLEAAAARSKGPGMDLAAQLEKDKKLLPDNILYGLGTGVMIGGWFAILQGKNARDNTRYLGMGVVVGTLLGMAIGTKSVYQPLLRGSNDPAPKPLDLLNPVLMTDHRTARAGLSLNLRF